MKSLVTKLLIAFSLFLGMANISFALPACPSSGNFHNCFGTYTWADGEKYVGEWKNGKSHGQGARIFGSNSKWAGDIYVGEHKNNLMHGNGSYSFATGDKYVGEFKNGNKHKGSYTYGPNSEWAGDEYAGEWKNDKFNGQGTYTFASGAKYIGEYKNHKRYGQGTYTYASGNKYVGEFKNDKRHGQGTFTFASGAKEVGAWENGKLNGYAILYNADGNIEQEGIFKDDKFLYSQKRNATNSTLPACPPSGYFHNCFGTYTWDNGDKYLGEFKDNKKHGLGTYTFADGARYVGEYKNDEINGQGTHTWGQNSKWAGDKYVGEYKNGKKHGHGTYTYADGAKYVGEYKNDEINGQGTYTWGQNSKWAGDKYVGEYKNGKKHGHGTYNFANGEKYVGEYKHGKKHGQGIVTFSDGDKYEGEWKNNKKHGQGTYTFADGEKYVGEYKNGKYHGKGTYTYANGFKEVGEYKNGKLNGHAIKYNADGIVYQEGIFKNDEFLYTQKRNATKSPLPACPTSGYFHNCYGSYTWDDGSQYVGEYKNDKRHGQGTLTWIDGNKYEGEWQNDKRHGQGTYTYVYGDKYVGEFKNDKRNGNGTYTYSNGDKYVGEYKDSNRHGQGTYTFADGKKEVGEWQNSKLNGYAIQYNADGSIDQEGIFKEGKFLYAQKGQNTKDRCDGDPALCTIVQLCTKASFYINGQKEWKTDYKSEKYVIEAKKNGVSCGVKSEIAKPSMNEILPAASGSGFFITKNGHVITNEHVVEGCQEVKVHHDGRVHKSIILSSDKSNDLALIKINYNPEVVFSLTKEPPYLGQELIAAGYPLVSDLGNTLKVTSGIVSALSAIDDTSKFQMDVPVQPGNSGGPIFDINGNVLGVVVARSTHEETQLVNFGIKAATVQNLIDANNIKLKLPNKEPINKRKFSEAMTRGTVLLSCWVTLTQIEELNTLSSGKVFFKEFQK